MAGDQFKIRVGTELDTSKLDAFERRIKSLNNSTIKLNIDASSVDKAVSSVNKQMNKGLKATADIDVKINDGSIRNDLKNQMKGLTVKAEVKPDFKYTQSDLKAETRKLQSQITSAMKLVDSTNASDAQISTAIKNLEAQQAVVDKIRNNLDKPITGKFADSINRMSAEGVRALDMLNAKAIDTMNNLISGKSLNLDFNKLRSQIESLDNVPAKLRSDLESLSKVNDRVLSFGKIDASNYLEARNAVKELSKGLEDLGGRYQLVQQQQRQMSRQLRNDNASRNLENAKKTFSLQIDNWLNNNSAAVDQFGDRLNSIKNRIADVGSSADLSALRSEFTQTTLEAKNADVAMMSFGDRLKRQFREYSSYVGIAGVFMAGSQAVRVMAQNVLEVDTAMTGLYRVTDMTAAQYDKLYDDMIAASKEYGTTLTDTINATSDWVRAGFDADTALGLADVTAMYQHISDLDYDEASENLLTAYNGFKDSFNEEFGGDAVASVEHIADAFNDLDNKYSVTSAGLGEGLARSASALQLAGNTFEEAAALVGATSEVTQNPEKAGNAMKVLSLRLRGMKGELEELGEESEGVENISKMQGQILNMTKGKVNIFDNVGNFRSTYDIMKDIADVYDELSSTDQANLLETIAGKDRANDVAALISNFDTAIKMVDTAENAAGSARAENEKYLDSLQGRIDVMTASMQALSTSAMDSGVLKGTISGVTLLIDGISSLIDTFGLVPTVAAAAAAGFSAFGNKGIVTVDAVNNKLNIFGKSLSEIRDIIDGFRLFGAEGGMRVAFGDQNPFKDFAQKLEKDKIAFENYKNLGGNATANDVTVALSGASDELRTLAHSGELAKISWDEFSASQKKSMIELQASNKSFKSAASIFKEYNNGGRNIGMTQTEIAEAVGNTNSVMGSYLSGLNGANATMGGYAKALVGATAKTVGLTVASTALNAVLTMGIGAAIGLAIAGISKLITYYDDLSKSVDDSSSAFQQANTSLMDNKSNYDSAVQSYDKLSKGVGKFGENLSLSADEYAEYQNAVNTIADAVPSVVSGFDAQGNAIISNKENVESLTNAYNELIATEAKAFINGDEDKGYVGLDEVAKDWAHERDKLSNNNTAEYDIEANKELQRLLTSKDIKKEINKLMKTADGQSVLADIGNQFADWGIDTKDINESYGQFVYDTIMNNASKVKEAADEYGAQLDDIAQTMNQQAMAFLNEAFYDDSKLGNLDDSVKNVISQYIGNLDGEFYDNLVARNGGDRSRVGEYLESYMNDLVSSLGNLTDAQQQTIADAFDFQIDFESGNISMETFAKKAQEVDRILKNVGLNEDARKDFMLSLGFEYNDDGSLKSFTKDYETALNRFKDYENKADIEKWLSGLTGSDLDIVMSMELDGDETIDELQHALDLTKALNGVGSIDINVESENLEKLNTALSESDSATGLTAESMDALGNMYGTIESYDPARLFERTANGIHLNAQAMREYQSEYEKTNKENIQKDLQTLQDEYQRLTDAMADASSPAETAALDSQRQNILDEISNVADLAAQYDGLTSSYNKWLQAKSGSEQGDMYDAMFGGIESTEELYNQGLVGTNEFREYVQMMTDEDLTNASTETIMGVYEKGMPLMKRYFTEGAEGAQNFLNDVQNLNSEWAHMNEDGSWEFNFGEGNDEEIAKALGISTEQVQSIIRKLNDYGFEVEIDSEFTGLEDLKTQAETAEEVLNDLASQGKIDFDYDFNFNTEDIDYLDEQITEATELLDQFKNEDGTVNIQAEGAEEAQAVLAALLQQKASLNTPAIMQVKVEDPSSEVGQAVAAVQGLYSAITERDINIAIGADTSGADSKIADLAGQLSALQQNNPELYAQLGLDTSEFNSALATINGNVQVGAQLDPAAVSTIQSGLSGISADVLAKVTGLDTSMIDGYTAPQKESTAKYDIDSSAVDSWVPPVKTGTAKYTVSLTSTTLPTLYGSAVYTRTIKGESPANGTAHINGTAFANGSESKTFKQGDWGIKGSGTALVGELGQEIVVRDGKYFTVGDNGAEFFQYRPGDIIFNHKQAEELFKNGYVTSNGGRGRAYAEGTAFSRGSGGFWGGASGGGGSSSSSSNKGSSSSKKSSSNKSSNSSTKQAQEEAEEFEETIDWIEIAIDRLERAIDRLDRTASSTFKTWTDRTKALNDQISETRREIDLQQKGYDRYIQQANSVGLDAGWAQKVRDGVVDISTITDEDLADKIKEYQEWYEKALDCKDAIDELRESESELYNQRFENISTKYDGTLGTIQHEADMLEESISMSEAKGWVTSTKYYEELIKNQQSQTEQLKKQRQEMLNEMKSGLESGAIKKGSETWYDQINAIDEITLKLKEAETQTEEWNNSIREINWQVFDMIQEQISNITTEADFLIDLMSNKKLYEDNGQLTDEGKATMGLHGQNYETYMYQSDKYAEEIAKLDSQIASDPYDQELIKRRQELLELQQESILNAEQEKEAIRDLVSDGIDKELDSLQSLIDKRNEALDSQKD